MKTTRIGLALGSGAARGWAHIGVIRALNEAGVRPAVISGSSIGALVGAAYAAGYLDALEQWVRAMNWREIVRNLDITLTGGGFIQGESLMASLARQMGDVAIEDLELPFAAVATELETGKEIWLQQGRLLDAVRASIALPGLFTPSRRDGRWLVDGGLVNPVPISVCRALGADYVIAVNLNGNIVGKHFRGQPKERLPSEFDALPTPNGRVARARGLLTQLWGPAEEEPGLFDVVAGALNIMQDRITRSRMAGDPPDLLIAPRLAHVGLMQFDRGGEAIDEGRASAERVAAFLQELS